MVLELILHLKNDVTFVKDRKKSKLLISTPIWKQTPVEMLAINFRLPAANLQLKSMPKIKLEQGGKGNNDVTTTHMIKQKDKQRHGRTPIRMQRSFHSQMPDEHDAAAGAVPSASWQHPQIGQNSNLRARSMERPPVDQDASVKQGEKFWSGPLRCSNYKSGRRDPVLMSQLAFEKLNNKEERRRSVPNTALQISHFSDLSKGHLISSITELVTTEEIYVKHLQKLISQYLRPSNLPILELTEKLLKVQTSFLTSLIDAAGDTVHGTDISEQQLRDALIRIFALFVNKCSKFKIYSEYSAGFLRFQQERKVWELEKINSAKQQGEGVQSLLIKPIQRVLKYPLFLQQMKDNCTKGCVERQQGEQALQRMHALADYINEMQRLIEQYGKDIEEIAAKNASASQMKFSQLLMFAHVDWLNSCEKGVTSCLAFVFTSVVLILCPTHSKNKGKFHKILPVPEVTITEGADEISESKYFFTINHLNTQQQTSETLQLCCCQVDVKNQFIKAVQKASTITKKDHRRPLSGSSQSDGGYGSDRHHS
ncbi:unnamed protein product [Enterobius vermicularis]|uniref:DH domain-containing protein n=1 Tax=Enterobius vermicularis TaxID=51028 RepID=A0A0N4VC30_ENTVE|nr:unnamed protein product [Enterobius vermicularis]